MTGPLLTKKQVAEVLAVSVDAIDRYCAAGKLAYVRIPAGKRFDPRDLEQFIESRKISHRKEV